MEPVPSDGLTMGEVMMRGNNVMKGYLKNNPPERFVMCRVPRWSPEGVLLKITRPPYLVPSIATITIVSYDNNSKLRLQK